MGKLTEEQLKNLIPEKYEFMQYLGYGGFGQVVQCLQKDTQEKVAIKLLYRNQHDSWEIEFLKKMMEKGLGQRNIVKMLDWFETTCGKGIVFECLDISFYDYAEELGRVPLSDIRAIVDQMATALDDLKSMRLLHTDIKPNNIMLSGSSGQIRAKLIDFGLVMRTDFVKPGMCASHICYRAPEVILGLHFNEAVDVWSLGVSVVNMLLRFPLIPEYSKFEALRIIVKLLGQPPDYLLNQSTRTKEFFYEEDGSWKILAKENLADFIGCQEEKEGYFTDIFDSLDEVIECEYEVLKCTVDEAFGLCSLIDLLKKMLQVDPAKRITSEEIHKHPFITAKYCEESGLSSEEPIESPYEVQTDSPVRSICETEVIPVEEPEPEPEPENITPPHPQEDQEVSMVSGMEKLTTEEFKRLLPEEFKCLRLLGDGSQGQVFRCRIQDTKKIVSVKLPHPGMNIQKEARLLEKMMMKDFNKHHIIKFYQTVDIGAGTALVCERLKMNLTQYKNQQQQIPLSDIRIIIQQAATALSALKSKKIIHTDLTTDSFWLVNNKKDPLKLKLVDFGLVIHRTKAKQGMVVQNIYNRAPEVILGVPFSEAIDVWSLGTIVVFMLLGYHIFSNWSEYETLKATVNLLGQPSDEVLNEGTKAKDFFKKFGNAWRLMTEKEYEEDFGMAAGDRQGHESEKFTSLHELIEAHVPVSNIHGKRQLLECIDLLYMMLEVNAADRITPDDILNHPFICQREETTSSEEEESEPMVIEVQPATPENTTAYMEDQQQCDCVASGDQKTPVKKGNDWTSKSPAPMPILVKSAPLQNTIAYEEDNFQCNSEEKTTPENKPERTSPERVPSDKKPKKKLKKKPPEKKPDMTSAEREPSDKEPERTLPEKTTPESKPEKKTKKKPKKTPAENKPEKTTENTPERTPERTPVINLDRTPAVSVPKPRIAWMRPRTLKNPIQYEMNRKVKFASPLTREHILDNAPSHSVYSSDSGTDEFSPSKPRVAWIKPKTLKNPMSCVEDVQQCISVDTGAEETTSDNGTDQCTPEVTAVKVKKNPLKRMWCWVKKHLSCMYIEEDS